MLRQCTKCSQEGKHSVECPKCHVFFCSRPCQDKDKHDVLHCAKLDDKNQIGWMITQHLAQSMTRVCNETVLTSLIKRLIVWKQSDSLLRILWSVPPSIQTPEEVASLTPRLEECLLTAFRSMDALDRPDTKVCFPVSSKSSKSSKSSETSFQLDLERVTSSRFVAMLSITDKKTISADHVSFMIAVDRNLAKVGTCYQLCHFG
jgi:hypothetical protein